MGLLSVVLTQYVLMSDEACTAASSLTVRVTIALGDGLRPWNGNPKRERGSSGVTVEYTSNSCRGLWVY